MGYWLFKKLVGKKVIIEERVTDKTIVGKLVGEDKFFLYVENAKIVVDGKASETPFIAVHKSRVAELRIAENS